MRRLRSRLLPAAIPVIASLLSACTSTPDGVDASPVNEIHPQGGGYWGGGGGNFGGGGGQWGGGGGNWGGGGGFWGGGGGLWGGGGGNWGGGGGQWGGGGGFWGGGGGLWGGGGGYWGGGGGDWGGGGGLWGGGFANTFPFLGWSEARHWQFRGVPKPGATISQAESASLIGGAYTSTQYTGYTGASYVKLNATGHGLQWSFMAPAAGSYELEFRYSNETAGDLPLQLQVNGATIGNQSFVPTGTATSWGISSTTVSLVNGANTIKLTATGTPGDRLDYLRMIPIPVASGTKDTATCPAGQVRLGGFRYPIDVEGWSAAVSLGYNSRLCIPTPGGGGLTMNPIVSDTSLAKKGGYALVGTTANASSDVDAIKTMVGFGSGNIATQYGGALCASIGTFAAAKRSCGVGVAFSDPNHTPGGGLTQRGVTTNAAQAASFSFNTPFGRNEGHSLYGSAPNDMESYAGQVLRKHKTKTVPTAASGIDGWNNSNAGSFAFGRDSFSAVSMTTSTNAAKLEADAKRSLVAPLNMIPVDAANVLTSDMQKSVAAANGDLYGLSLHSLAFNQSPLYGSGGGRWFFKAGTDLTKPLLDLSSVYQGSGYIVTGQLSGSPVSAQLSNALISELTLRYADWRGEPSGTLFIDRAGQSPATIAADANREARLAAALRLDRPLSNMASGSFHTCAIATAGGGVKCWGRNQPVGSVGDGTSSDRMVATDVTGLSSGAIQLAGGNGHTCALLSTGGVKCWGENDFGQLGSGGTVTSSSKSLVPVQVVGLTSGIKAIAAGGDSMHTCALTTQGGVKCWGDNQFGQLGNGGSPSLSTTAVNVTGLSSGVASISVGAHHTCALMQTGTVKCWGRSQSLQLGKVGTANAMVPIDVAGLTGIQAISAGAESTCALTGVGGVKCWGADQYGQLGDGAATATPRSTPADVSGVASGATSISSGNYHSCAVLTNGSIKCWGQNWDGSLGDGTTVDPRPTAVTVVNLGGTASSVQAASSHTCARLSSGVVKCWGYNFSGQIGNNTVGNIVLAPAQVVAAVGSVNNANVIASQGSVLVTKTGTVAGSPVAGHITPIPWSMSKTSTGTQALMVTYDPLAVAAAVFIEQFDAHIAACNATTSETMTEHEQLTGAKLWACSKPDTKTAYLAGMRTFLTGARAYLFGQDDGCIANTSVDGVACGATTKMAIAAAHLPYTFVVPDYTTAAFDSGYYAQVDSALATYRTAILASSANRLDKTLQLAGIAKFTTDNAVVTSRVTRSGAYANISATDDCVVGDGFTSQ